MSRGLSSALKAAIADPVVRWVALCRFDFDGGTIAFHSGLGLLTYAGQEYLGFGTLGSITKLSENGSLDPTHFSCSLSGINPAVLSAVLNENYLNRPSICHLAALDESGQIIDAFIYFQGKIDEIGCQYGSTCAVTITVRDDLADWARPRIERYTDQDQQARHPGDRGFEYVSTLANKQVIWPAKTWFENNR